MMYTVHGIIWLYHVEWLLLLVCNAMFSDAVAPQDFSFDPCTLSTLFSLRYGHLSCLEPRIYQHGLLAYRRSRSPIQVLPGPDVE